MSPSDSSWCDRNFPGGGDGVGGWLENMISMKTQLTTRTSDVDLGLVNSWSRNFVGQYKMGLYRKRIILLSRMFCRSSIFFLLIFSRHYVKNIDKKVYKSSKLASCPNLKYWKKSVKNTIWWAIKTSKGINGVIVGVGVSIRIFWKLFSNFFDRQTRVDLEASVSEFKNQKIVLTNSQMMYFFLW